MDQAISSSVAASPSPEHRLICLVCHQQFSLYTCPRCNLRYCSLACYKSHSDRCVESFNRDNVLGEMKDLNATPEARQRMMETLKRFYLDSNEGRGDGDGGCDLEVAEEDDGNFSVLSERALNKIASGEQIELNDLSPEEKRAFFRAVASGEFSHMIKPWEPWWLNPFLRNVSLNKQGNRLVQPMGSSVCSQFQGDSAKGIFDAPAPLDSPLPPLKQLTSMQPSALLGVHLTEVLYSYCFTLRFYNGDWLCDALDAALSSLSVSQVLGQGNSPETISEALNGCLESICSPLFKSAGGFKFALALLDDAVALLRLGRPGVICSLSELHRMFDTAANDLKQSGGYGTPKKEMSASKCEQMGKHSELVQSRGSMNSTRTNRTKTSINSGKAGLKQQIVGACRKVYFLLCWANERSDDIFSSLALLAEAEKVHFTEIDAKSSAGELEKKRVSDSCNRKHFIEEIH